MRGRVVVSAGLALVTVVGMGRAQDFDRVELTTVPVTDGVFVVGGGGGNIGVLVGDDGMLLIDTAYGELEGKIRTALERIGGGPIRFVINTHWHFDHVGCNGCFSDDGAVVIAPRGTRDRMATEQDFPLLEARSPAFSGGALPTIEVDDEASLHFGGEELRLARIADAHSGSDLVVLIEGANVLHAGDLFWSEGYPYIGTPHGGSIDGIIAAVDRMLEMTDDHTMVIPGHGGLSDRAGLIRYRDLLDTVRTRVAAQIAEGRTVEEIVSSRPTADWDEQRTVGMSPEVFVRLVHRDLIDTGTGTASH
jgi:cyclase